LTYCWELQHICMTFLHRVQRRATKNDNSSNYRLCMSTITDVATCLDYDNEISKTAKTSSYTYKIRFQLFVQHLNFGRAVLPCEIMQLTTHKVQKQYNYNQYSEYNKWSMYRKKKILRKLIPNSYHFAPWYQKTWTFEFMINGILQHRIWHNSCICWRGLSWNFLRAKQDI